MDLHERLVAARKSAGFDTAKEAAEAIGVPYQTYAGHENGNSGFRSDKGELYARRFKVRFEWLMRGTGQMTEALTPKQAEVLDLFAKVHPDDQDAYLAVLRSLKAGTRPEVQNPVAPDPGKKQST